MDSVIEAQLNTMLVAAQAIAARLLAMSESGGADYGYEITTWNREIARLQVMLARGEYARIPDEGYTTPYNNIERPL